MVIWKLLNHSRVSAELRDESSRRPQARLVYRLRSRRRPVRDGLQHVGDDRCFHAAHPLTAGKSLSRSRRLSAGRRSLSARGSGTSLCTELFVPDLRLSSARCPCGIAGESGSMGGDGASLSELELGRAGRAPGSSQRLGSYGEGDDSSVGTTTGRRYVRTRHEARSVRRRGCLASANGLAESQTRGLVVHGSP